MTTPLRRGSSFLGLGARFRPAGLCYVYSNVLAAFSVGGSVCIEAVDRAGRGRPLRYCARPPFALDRPREPERLLYESTKPGSGGIGPLLPTPLETARPPRRAGAAAVDPPSSLLRCADANGRSREIFAATPSGRFGREPPVRLLLDHLVRAHEQRLWNGDSERLRSLQVDSKLESSRLLHRQFGGLCAAENPVDE